MEPDVGVPGGRQAKSTHTHAHTLAHTHTRTHTHTHTHAQKILPCTKDDFKSRRMGEGSTGFENKTI